MIEESSSADRIVIYPSRAKLILSLLGAVAFVALGAWIATPEVADWEVAIASYVGVPFFGAVAVYLVYRLLNRKPALVIDATGLTDAAAAGGAGHLKWEEIAFVVPYQYSGQWILGVVPADLGALMARRSMVRRVFMNLNVRMGLPPVNVPQAVLPMTVEDLAALLQTRYGVRIGADA